MVAVVLLLCLLGGALAAPDHDTRIVGGSPTSITQYPYMSNMRRQYWWIWWNQACGGSLITTTAVLSAAHCYYGDSAASWRVILGSSWREGGGSEHKVSQIRIHSGFVTKTLVHDVAIVKLETPATLSSSIKTAKIAGANYLLSDRAVVYAVGWGTTSSGGSSSDQLRHVAINVINQKICADRYEELKTRPGYYNNPSVTSGMLCAGILDVGGKDTCQGDSGGPLAQQGNVVVGITSWGQGCANSFYPGVYTRVSVYSNWIVNNA